MEFNRKVSKRESTWATINLPIPVLRAWESVSEVTLTWDESDPTILIVRPAGQESE